MGEDRSKGRLKGGGKERKKVSRVNNREIAGRNYTN